MRPPTIIALTLLALTVTTLGSPVPAQTGMFALLFVAAVGLGPFAGVLGIALHTWGSTAKLWAEAIENIPPGPLEAAAATGASRVERVAPAEARVSGGAAEVIRAEGLAKRYPPHVDALAGVSLVVRRGEFVALLGPSGAGKTTLFRCLTGLTRPDAGSVSVDGHAVTSLPAGRGPGVARARAPLLGGRPSVRAHLSRDRRAR